MFVKNLVAARRARLLSACADAELVAETLRESLTVGLLAVVSRRSDNGSGTAPTAVLSLVLGAEAAKSLDTLLDGSVAQAVEVEKTGCAAAVARGSGIGRRLSSGGSSGGGSGSLGIKRRSHRRLAVNRSSISLAIVGTQIQATIKKDEVSITGAAK